LAVTILRTARARASDPDTALIEDFSRRTLATPEIRAALRNTGLTPESVTASMVRDRVEILASAELTLYERVRFRQWLRDLAESTAEVQQKHPSARNLLFALVTPWLVVPLLALIWSFPAGLLLFGAEVLAVLFVIYRVGASTHRSLWAEDKALEHLRETVLLPRVREHINLQMRSGSLEESFQVTSAPALVDLSERKHLVATASIKRMDRATAAIPTGSIGISGPRGIGKTTLLRRFCDSRFAHPNQPDLRILIPAPVQYDARDFVVHTFGRLCDAVISVSGEAPRPARWNATRLLVRLLGLLGAATALAGFLYYPLPNGSSLLEQPVLWIEYVVWQLGPLLAFSFLAAYMSARHFQRKRPTGSARSSENDRASRNPDSSPSVDVKFKWTPRAIGALVGSCAVALHIFLQGPPEERFDYGILVDPHVLGPAIAVVGGILVYASIALDRRIHRREEEASDIPSLARRHQRRIRYIETVTTGVTASVQLMKPAQLSGNRSKALAELESSYPQVVGQYREFATQAATWWNTRHQGKGRLVIGIDEIDKMEADAAERFVNDTKALFGTPHCLNLVSVSEDALIGYERRGFSVRDSFDTAFDDVVRVEHLSYEDVHHLLTLRVAGLPNTLVALCYVLSGGLPRECLRVARAAVLTTAEYLTEAPGQIPRVAKLARNAVLQEIATLREALLSSTSAEPAKNLDHTSKAPLLTTLDSDWPGATPDEVADSALNLMKDEHTHTLGVQLAFLSTVLTLFDDGGRRLARGLRDKDPTMLELVSVLAEARATGPRNPKAQAHLVDRFFTGWESAHEGAADRGRAVGGA
jgi:hypothetical protein